MKSYKTCILVIIVILFNTDLFSQGQGMRRGYNQSYQPRVKSGNTPQFIVYDSEEVVKKIKLKNKTEVSQIGLAIEVYNDKMIEIKAFESESLNVAKIFMAQKRKEFKQSGDRFIMQEAQIKIKELLTPLRKKVDTQNELLNSKFKKLLSEKQYNKWLKYQKIKLRPKTPNQNNHPQIQQRRGRGQGQGRRY